MANRAYKGRVFEIRLAARLSLWWTGGERDDVLWHTGDSGGRATRRARKGRQTANQCGDLYATDPVAQPLLDVFAFEAKRGYPRATVGDLADRPARAKAQTYEEWIAQAAASQKNAGAKSWAIIHQRDRREAVIWIPERVALALLPDHDLSLAVCPAFQFAARAGPGRAPVRVWGTTLDEFLRAVTPRAVRRLLR